MISYKERGGKYGGGGGTNPGIATIIWRSSKAEENSKVGIGMEHELIIAQQGVKRALDVARPFNLCLSKDTARMLIRQLEQCTKDEWSYGWITVFPHTWVDDSPPNTRPLRWTEYTPKRDECA